MALSRSAKTYLTLAVVLLFLGIAGVATYFVTQRFFVSQETTETRSRASLPTGVVKMTLETVSNTRYVGDYFPVNIYIDTAGNYISAAALGLSYTSSGTTPELEVVDADPSRGGIQIISNVAQGMEGCADQINTVSRQTSGEFRVFIDFGATCGSATGFRTNGKVLMATILFKANRPVTKTLEHDPSKAIVTLKDSGQDVLQTIEHINLSVLADTQGPSVSLVKDSLSGTTTVNSVQYPATRSGNVYFEWTGSEQPPRATDTALLDTYVKFRHRFDGTAFASTLAYTPDRTITRSLAHGLHTIYVEGNDVSNNKSTVVSKQFFVDLTPFISGITPTSAAGGETIVINGFNFGSVKRTVRFGTVDVTGANIVSWTDNRIEVRVPANAGATVQVVMTSTSPAVPPSNTVAFSLNTNLRVVMNLQGLGQDRGSVKVDVVVSRGTFKQTFTGVNAKWSATENTYELVTPALDQAAVTAANYVVTVKPVSRLRKRFANVTITRGTRSNLVKKAAADMAKAGDVNNDNKISIFDFGEFSRPGVLVGLSTPVTSTNAKFDLNGDGVLTATDVAILLSNYTQLETLGEAEI